MRRDGKKEGCIDDALGANQIVARCVSPICGPLARRSKGRGGGKPHPRKQNGTLKSADTLPKISKALFGPNRNYLGLIIIKKFRLCHQYLATPS